ncbi:MAG: Omp28-related outer membrane protein [Bacteroidetes bacterium]|nr:MAG: Omp28-related outer membrane protein [Bacteroidota bacterium]
MKKFFTIIFCLGLIYSQANAQQWVSTQVEKRNVILEEFTGIHCGYCPDGHKIANQLVEDNPGRVFLVNIHAGGYAKPGAGEPDLRTTVGTPIDGASGLQGYPAGSVNRSTTPWAKNRDEWTNIASGILNQNSPVNVAVKSHVDFSTRELTTEVEIYYTSNSPELRNYLSVFLTQDNILGPQSDYGNYNPTNWNIDGKYRHNHVLRMAISSGGSFGESIDTTTKDHYEYRKYITTLPQNINNLDIELYNLHVVAFVSETQSNIYSGAGTEVEYDPSLKVDLGFEDKTEYPTSYCISSINPKVEVTNNSAQNISNFDIEVSIGGNKILKSFSGNLAPNQKTTIDWGEIQYSPHGLYSLIIEGFKNINGNTQKDMNFRNDTKFASGIGFTQKAFSLFTANFDDAVPQNMMFDLYQNPYVYLITSPRCGADNSLGALRFALHSIFGVSGLPVYMIFGEAELSKLNKHYLCFYYAYSDDNYGGTKPQIKVQLSDDCGINWEDVSNITPEETGNPSIHGNWYIPASTEYKPIQVSLEPYKTKDVILRIVVIPGTAGNALYIDELTLGPNILGLDDEVVDNNFTLYPNPADNEIRFGNENYVGKEFSIYSLVGELMMSGSNANNRIDISKLNSGLFYIKINNEILKFSKN